MSLSCHRCGYSGDPKLEPCGQHIKAVCARCGAYIKFLPQHVDAKGKRENKHTDLAKKYTRGFCDLCGLLEKHIPVKESFHGHHVDQYVAKGSNEHWNIWVLCTWCHQIVHQIRDYKKHLIPEHFYEFEKHPEQPEVLEAVDQLGADPTGEGTGEEDACPDEWLAGQEQ